MIAARVSDVKKIRGGVLFVEEFPLTSSGKLIRRKVTEILMNRI
jgi:4-coumarate--CoA ligase